MTEKRPAERPGARLIEVPVKRELTVYQPLGRILYIKVLIAIVPASVFEKDQFIISKTLIAFCLF